MIAGRLITFLSKDINHLQSLPQLPSLKTNKEQVNFLLAGHILSVASCTPVDNNQFSFIPQTSAPSGAKPRQLKISFTR